jgi:hypothetical protein
VHASNMCVFRPVDSILPHPPETASAKVATSPAVFGGDSPVWSRATNSLVSLTDPLQDRPIHTMTNFPPLLSSSVSGLPAGYTILRRCRWIGPPTASLNVSFRLKLSSTHRISDTNDESPSDSVPLGTAPEPSWALTAGAHVGYEWSLFRCHHDGVGSQVDDGRYSLAYSDRDVEAKQQDQERDQQDKEEWKRSRSSNPPAAITPWLWREWTACLEDVSLNDGIVLCARVTLPPSAASTEVLSRCCVTIESFNVSMPLEEYRGWEDLLDEALLSPTLLYNCINDQSLSVVI